MSTTTPEPLDPSFRISLPSFEGPLDLLLHLIKKHELDILDLPIAFVTERYLSYITLMEQLNLDIASEYLVMAATLAHIKSKMLLPQEPEDQAEEETPEEEVDPRAELIRRLLEYQKYKDAAEQLGARGIAGRDVFLRGTGAPEASGPPPLAEMSIFKLLDAFQAVLARAKADLKFEITAEGVSIQERMRQLTELLREKRELTFEELFEGQVTVYDIVITFMALLEMAKRRLVRIYQADPHSPIHLRSTVLSEDGADVGLPGDFEPGEVGAPAEDSARHAEPRDVEGEARSQERPHAEAASSSERETYEEGIEHDWMPEELQTDDELDTGSTWFDDAATEWDGVDDEGVYVLGELDESEAAEPEATGEEGAAEPEPEATEEEGAQTPSGASELGAAREGGGSATMDDERATASALEAVFFPGEASGEGAAEAVAGEQADEGERETGASGESATEAAAGEQADEGERASEAWGAAEVVAAEEADECASEADALDEGAAEAVAGEQADEGERASEAWGAAEVIGAEEADECASEADALDEGAAEAVAGEPADGGGASEADALDEGAAEAVAGEQAEEGEREADAPGEAWGHSETEASAPEMAEARGRAWTVEETPAAADDESTAAARLGNAEEHAPPEGIGAHEEEPASGTVSGTSEEPDAGRGTGPDVDLAGGSPPGPRFGPDSGEALDPERGSSKQTAPEDEGEDEPT